MGRNSKSLFEKEHSVKNKKGVGKVKKNYSQSSITLNNEDVSILKRISNSKGIDISTLLVGSLGFIIKNGLLNEFVSYLKSLGYIGLYINKEDRYKKSKEGRPSFLSVKKTEVDRFIKDVEGGGLIVLKELIKFKLSKRSIDRQLFYQYNRNGNLNLLRVYDVKFYINDEEFNPKNPMDYYSILLERKVKEVKVNVRFQNGGVEFMDGGSKVYSSGKVSLSSLRRTLTDRNSVPFTIEGLLEDIKTFVSVSYDHVIAAEGDSAVRCLSNYHPKRMVEKEFIDVCRSYDSSDSFLRKVKEYYKFYRNIN